MTEVITFEELKDQFKLKLEQKNSKQYFIENEIDKLKDFVSSKPNYSRLKSYFGIKIYLDSKLLLEAFESFINDEEYSIQQRYHERDLAFEVRKKGIIQVKQLVNYYNWLTELKYSLENKSNTSKSELTNKQKMLLLYYFGFEFKKNHNTKYGILLENIIGYNSEDARKDIPHLLGENNKVKNLKNLKAIYDFLKNLGFKEILENIEKEIIKYKK